MKIKSIDIRNFRCFTDLPIEFHQNLMVFVGGNGSGKTTLLNAICTCLAPILARLPFDHRAQVPGITPSDIHLTGVDHSAPFTFLAMHARLLGDEDVVWDRAKLRDNSKTTQATLPRPRNETRTLYGVIDRIIDAHNDGRPYDLPVFAYYSTSRAVNLPHNRMQPRAIPNSFRRLMGLHGALEATTNFRRAVAYFDLLEQRALREQRDNEFPEASRSLKVVRRAIEAMIPEVSNPRIDGKTGRFAVDLHDPTGTKIRLHLDQLSDGYQVMLGVVMDFALRLALANPPRTPESDVLATEAVLIIDEVDLHLHPLWQQRVIPDLRRTFPNSQLILTTHSPQVATTVPSESLRVLSSGKIQSVPAGSEGAAAERLLVDVFGAPTRSPHVKETNDLKEYMDLVDRNQADSPRARELRTELDEWSQGNEPLLKRLDLRIANQKWASK